MEARTGWQPPQGQHRAVEKVVASGPEIRLRHGEPLHDPLGLLVCYTVTVSPKDSREAPGRRAGRCFRTKAMSSSSFS